MAADAVPRHRRDPWSLQDSLTVLLAAVCLAGLAFTIVHLADDWRAAADRVEASRRFIEETTAASRAAAASLPRLTEPGAPLDTAAARNALDQLDERILQLQGRSTATAVRVEQADGVRRAAEGAHAGEVAKAREAYPDLQILPTGLFDPGKEPSRWKWVGASHWAWSERKRWCDRLNHQLNQVNVAINQHRSLVEAAGKLQAQLAEAQRLRNQVITDLTKASEAAAAMARRSAETMREANAAVQEVDAEQVERARRTIAEHPSTRTVLLLLHLPVAFYFLWLGLGFVMRLAVLRRWLGWRTVAV